MRGSRLSPRIALAFAAIAAAPAAAQTAIPANLESIINPRTIGAIARVKF